MNARGIIRTVPGLGTFTRSPAAQKGIRAARRAAVLRSSSAFAAHELAEALLKRAGYETRGSCGVTYGTVWGWK